jgi:hypothetical protein
MLFRLLNVSFLFENEGRDIERTLARLSAALLPLFRRHCVLCSELGDAAKM